MINHLSKLGLRIQCFILNESYLIHQTILYRHKLRSRTFINKHHQFDEMKKNSNCQIRSNKMINRNVFR